jgi:DNA replication protein DnaC
LGDSLHVGTEIVAGIAPPPKPTDHLLFVVLPEDSLAIRIEQLPQALRLKYALQVVPLHVEQLDIPRYRDRSFRMHTTLAQLRTLKLDGLAAGLEEQLAQPGLAALSFEEHFALLIDREVPRRNDRKLLRLLKNAYLKYGQAAIEDIDTRSGRGVDRREVMSLALGDWASAGHSVLITGPTGSGKSWLGCALARHACRRGHSALYQRVPRLQEELRIRHDSGSFGKWLVQLAKTDVLLLDDWGMGRIDGMTRSVCLGNYVGLSRGLLIAANWAASQIALEAFTVRFDNVLTFRNKSRVSGDIPLFFAAAMAQ